MVLVDPADDEKVAGSPGPLVQRIPLILRWPLVYAARGFSYFGLFRLLTPTAGRPPQGMTPDQWATIGALRRQRKAHLAELRGGPNLEEANLERVHSVVSLNLGDLPLIVLTAGKAPSMLLTG